ncbi:conserved hypothetical protein, membrane [mine drainage metagenome]|uniref:DUF2784 domain-containing protein n=1 Tax=mine drainage metagenome TaxID=410659 RepID=T1B432_9ZZZZ
MIWRILADGLVVVHLAFVGFVILGGFLAWKWRRAAFAHIPALAWGLWVEVSGQICPLTALEQHLRHLAGQAGYRGGFLRHYLLPILYPHGLTRPSQWALAGLLLAINAIAYGRLWALREHRLASARND